MKTKLLSLFLLLGFSLFGIAVSSQDKIDPKISSSLGTVKAADGTQEIDTTNRERIVRTMTEYYVESVHGKKPEYISLTDAVLQDLERLIPGIKNRATERGLSARTIVRVLNADPVNKTIINDFLMGQKSRSCK